MNCRRILRMLSAFQDGEIVSRSRREVERHLGECAACRREFEEMGRLRERLLRLPPPAVDPHFSVRVMALLPARAATPNRLLQAAALAAVFIAVFLGGFLLKTSVDATAAGGRPPAATFSSVLLEPQEFGLLAIHDDTIELFNGGGHEQE